jgi:Phytanoyl-CoA dioxygenase (PhyH)
MSANFHQVGFEIVGDFISPVDIEFLGSEIEKSLGSSSFHGIRSLNSKVHAIGELANSSYFLKLAADYLGNKPQLVRAIYFNKTKSANWGVAWHQDKTIAVNTRAELLGYGPWSIKDNVWHVQPPIDVLEQMVTFRIHLDAANESNGCLKVIPGSHLSGIIAESDIRDIIEKSEMKSCIVNAGDALVMRPLLLHSSNKATVLNSRRVIHLEYSSFNLPNELKWI